TVAGIVATAASGPGFPLTARVDTPMSLRPHLALPALTMGVYICGHESDERASGYEPFWRFAAEYGRKLQSALPAAYQRIGLLAFAKDVRAVAASRENDHA